MGSWCDREPFPHNSLVSAHPISFEQRLCELKRLLMKIKQFLSIAFPFTLFALLPVWSRWLDDWYLLTMLIVIITVSFEVLLPSCLFLFPSSFMHIFLSCVPQIPDILSCLFSLAMEILFDMERKSNNEPVMYEVTNEVLNSTTVFLKILEA